MEFLSYFHGVNIVSICNTPGGKGSLETYRTLSTSVPSCSLNVNDPVIYIYHHMYKRPFEAGRVANHWGWLEPVNIKSGVYKDADIFDLDPIHSTNSRNASSTNTNTSGKKESRVQSLITGAPVRKKAKSEAKQFEKQKKQSVGVPVKKKAKSEEKQLEKQKNCSRHLTGDLPCCRYEE